MKKIFNIMITILSIWFVCGFTLRYIYNTSPPRRYSDVEMSEVFVKDHPELKATWKQLDGGRIRIKPRNGKPLYLKDGVITKGK
jgi:hypothetical protein